MKSFFKSHYYLLVVLVTSASAIVLLNKTNSEASKSEKKNYLFVPPSIHLRHFAFGHKDTFADIFWLRLMQDFGYCDQDRSHLGSPLTPEGVRRGRNRTPECSKGWGYHMLNLITELAPRFKLAHEVGPMSLSVLADDIDGATELFAKAAQLSPENWKIHYQAGYHYLSELEEKSLAAGAFTKAYKLGGPEWLPLLVARLNNDMGLVDVAKTVLEDFILKVQDNKKLLDRAEKKLKEYTKKNGDH